MSRLHRLGRNVLAISLIALSSQASLAARPASAAPAAPQPSGVQVSTAQAHAAQAPGLAAAEIDRLLQGEIFNASPVDTASAANAERASASALVGLSSDETFLRRVSLDLIGRSPSAEEITLFSLDPSPDKRARAVERLLADNEYGQNWGRYWRDVILYRRTEDRALLVADPLQKYLADNLNRGAGWDQLARSFITASGDVREQGETAIFVSQMGETSDIAAETSRLFLGIQIQCAQCHDHKTDRWKREQFHELAAFFPRTAVRPVKGAQRSFEVVSVDKVPKVRKQNNRPRANPEHYMPDLENPQAKGTLMQPMFFVTGAKLPLGTTDVERRQTLAGWITDSGNPWFAKALVNRLWSELVGEGFYEPVDDIGPDRDCNAPQTLDYLASQFVANGHDIKWLMQTITATQAYQRESRSRRGLKDKPWLASCPQRLRGDQLFDALLVALEVNELPGGGRPGKGGAQAALRTPRGRFNETFGYDPSVSREEVGGSIPQALLLMNGPDVNRAINGKPNAPAGLSKLLAMNSDNRQAVVELYLRCLAREPSDEELETCLAHVQQAGNRAVGFEDLQWALINSTEFLHRK